MDLVRGHWGVENGLHFIKDRWWDEDRQWSLRPGLAERLAMLRDTAVPSDLHARPTLFQTRFTLKKHDKKRVCVKTTQTL